MGARRHDDAVGVVGGEVEFLQDAVLGIDQLVGGEISEVVQGFHALLAQRHQHRRGQLLDGGHLVGDAQFLALARSSASDSAFDPAPGHGPFNSPATSVSKPSMPAQIFGRHKGDFLDRGETLGHQQMGDDVVNIERIHEGLRTRLELFLTALGFLRFGQDVDVETGELARPGARSGRGGRSPG